MPSGDEPFSELFEFPRPSDETVSFASKDLSALADIVSSLKGNFILRIEKTYKNFLIM